MYVMLFMYSAREHCGLALYKSINYYYYYYKNNDINNNVIVIIIVNCSYYYCYYYFMFICITSTFSSMSEQPG